MKTARLMIALLLLPGVALAAVETTTVNEKVYVAQGVAATSGTIVAQLSTSGRAPDTGTGLQQAVIGRVSATIDPNGRPVGLTLVPNDVITPSGTYYTVSISAKSGTLSMSATEKWSVTTSPDPVAIGAITRLNTAPGLTETLDNASDVTITGLSNNQCLKSSVPPGTWENKLCTSTTAPITWASGDVIGLKLWNDESGGTPAASSPSGLQTYGSVLGGGVGLSLLTGCADGQTLQWDAVSTEWDCAASGGAPAFSALTTGSNTTATMTVGSGATMTASGTGTITSNRIPTGNPACGAGTAGKLQVMSTAARLRGCDSAATPAIFYTANADVNGKATSAATADTATTATTASVADDLVCATPPCVDDSEVDNSITASNYLPLAGGTMTGTITTRDTDPAITIPKSASFSTWDSGIRFNSRAGFTSGPWIIQNQDYMSGEGSEDHVLMLLYNARFGVSTSPGSSSMAERITAGEHAVKWGFESGFCGATCDPATKLGQVEMVLDIDLDTAGTTFGIDKRPWFYAYDMDRQAAFWSIGVVTDPNSTYVEMGLSGAGDFIVAGKSNPIIFMDKAQALAELPGDVSPTSANSMARFIVDPGGDYVFAGATNRAAMIGRHAWDAALMLESGIQSNGTTRGPIYIGKGRNTTTVVGTAQAGNGSYFTVDGFADQIQATIQGHSTQTANILVVEQSGGTDALSVSNDGLVTAVNLRLSSVGSATIDYGSLTAPNCADVDAGAAAATIAVTGSATGDLVTLGLPTGGMVAAGSVFNGWVSAAGTVTVRHCCIVGTCNPDSATYRATVIKQ